MKEERDSFLFLKDILQNIQKLENFTSEGKNEFIHSDLIQYAVLKCLENIGEATKHVPIEYKNILPETAWRGASRARDFFAHHYFGIDVNMVWDIIVEDIPPLKSAVQQIISQIEQKNSPSEEQGMSM